MQQLNALCDRNTKLNTKGGSYFKTKKVMVVVFSNYSISECYHKALDRDNLSLDPLYCRFREVQLTHVYDVPYVGDKRTVVQALMPEVIQC